jgi:CO/xanthine dehydrogenase Mo-binding subunit
MFDELAAELGVDPIAFRLGFMNDQRMRAVIEAVTRQAGWKPGASPSGIGRGFSYFFYDRPGARAAAAAEVDVDRASGRVNIRRIVAGFDIGRIVNPDGVRNQMEGGIIQAISRTLKEQVTYDDSGITSVDWSSYPIIGFSEIPTIEIVLLDRPTDPPGGAGEAQTPIIPGAIANAIFDAVGVRIRGLPLTPGRVKSALAAQ